MQVEHKTEKGTVLFVKVLDDSFGYWINPVIKHLLHYHTPKLSGMSDIDCHTVELSHDYFVLIGLTSEVTEEQLSEILDTTFMYKKHGVKSYKFRSYIDGFLGFKAALDSFKSLMEYLYINESEKWVVLFK